MLFLDTDEIYQLTGFKLASAQCRWLLDNGYPFDKNASGKPKVLRSYLEKRLGQPGISLNHETPNFAALL
ncbi:MAG TPA: hypothetical protein DCO68_09370 [Methylophilaceae bacterium]|nr:hypothetical protein [Methylophilaceae bacterium]